MSKPVPYDYSQQPYPEPFNAPTKPNSKVLKDSLSYSFVFDL